jgi:hypothetical protein
LEQVKEDWRKLNLKEARCTDTLILAVTDDIEADRQICIHSLASAHRLAHFFPFLACKEECVMCAQMLLQEQMEKREKASAYFFKMIKD